MQERLFHQPFFLSGADDGGGTLAHRDVIAEHHHRAPVDAGVAADLAVPGGAVTVLGPGRVGEAADLAKGTVVDQRVNALPDGVPTPAVDAIDALQPAHLGANDLRPGGKIRGQLVLVHAPCLARRAGARLAAPRRPPDWSPARRPPRVAQRGRRRIARPPR